MPHIEVQSLVLRLDLVNAKLYDLRKKLGRTEIELFKSQI